MFAAPENAEMVSEGGEEVMAAAETTAFAGGCSCGAREVIDTLVWWFERWLESVPGADDQLLRSVASTLKLRELRKMFAPLSSPPSPPEPIAGETSCPGDTPPEIGEGTPPEEACESPPGEGRAPARALSSVLKPRLGRPVRLGAPAPGCTERGEIS